MEFRSKGFAKKLFTEAKRKLKVNYIAHSPNLSEDGRAFATNVF